MTKGLEPFFRSLLSLWALARTTSDDAATNPRRLTPAPPVDALFAQVFVWNGNASVNVDVISIKLEIEGALN
jgi:hypothetical protein